jgi:DeoR family transcriptional regulator of aga operon
VAEIGSSASVTLPRVHQSDRLGTVLEELSRNGSVSVAELSARFDVSVATVRRDLKLLEEQRLVARIHGGAVPRGLLYELPLRYKAARHHEEKRRIAVAAAEIVDDGATVGLTGGTTTTEVARALADRPRLTVVTNALNVASELAVRTDLKLVVLGGVARPESYELVGPIAEATLAGLNLDLVFLGVDGITAEAGCTTHHEVEASTNRALMRRAKRVVVVADSSKLGQVAFARICTIDEIDNLITDSEASSPEIERLESAGLAIDRR